MGSLIVGVESVLVLLVLRDVFLIKDGKVY